MIPNHRGTTALPCISNSCIMTNSHAITDDSVLVNHKPHPMVYPEIFTDVRGIRNINTKQPAYEKFIPKPDRLPNYTRFPSCSPATQIKSQRKQITFRIFTHSGNHQSFAKS